jgi:hypothetical protein
MHTTLFKGPTLTPLQLSYFLLGRDGHKNKGTQKAEYIKGKLEFHMPRKMGRLRKD